MASIDESIEKIIKKSMIDSLPFNDLTFEDIHLEGNFREYGSPLINATENRKKIAINFQNHCDSYIREFDKKTGNLLFQLDIPGEFDDFISPISYVGSELYLAGFGSILKIDEEGDMFRLSHIDERQPRTERTNLYYIITGGGNVHELKSSNDEKKLLFTETNYSAYMDVSFDTQTNIFHVRLKDDKKALPSSIEGGFELEDCCGRVGDYKVRPKSLNRNVYHPHQLIID